ncbi:hypothetical protein Tco_0823017 [Tanacetum coccineum]|uniref:Uncharacterized protein n=1 Tax=Tanacetum coccineum TaxID=301880 RepID=A0ABQ5AL15_9ASTR
MMTYLKHVIKRSDEDFQSLLDSAEEERERTEDSSGEEDKEERVLEKENLMKKKKWTMKKLDRKYPIKEWKTECLGTKPQPDQAEPIEDINLNVEKYQDDMPKGLTEASLGRFDGSSGIHTLVTDTGLVIHMLVEKKYPLRKEVLMQMLKLKLESEEENTMALELIKFVKKILAKF